MICWDIKQYYFNEIFCLQEEYVYDTIQEAMQMHWDSIPHYVFDF